MTKYIYPGTAKIVFAPSVSNIAAPTQAEINAGTALSTPGVTGQMKVAKDWGTDPGTIEVPDVGTTFVGTIPGMTSGKSASIDFYDDDTSTTIRTALAEGTAGYVIIMRRGQAATRRAEVFPVKVNTVNDADIDAGSNAPAMFTVTFSVTSVPNKNAVQAS